MRLLSTRAVNAAKKSNRSPGLHQRLGRGEGPTAGEHPQSTKQHPFAGSEQVVAPGNGTAQRLLPRGKIPGTTGQQGQAPLEPLQQRLRRQHLDARGRQLDRER